VAVELLLMMIIKNKNLHGLEPASELYRPSDRRLSAKLVPTFADRGCHMVRLANPYGRILGFLDRDDDENINSNYNNNFCYALKLIISTIIGHLMIRDSSVSIAKG
jgi:hypothetical protein